VRAQCEKVTLFVPRTPVTNEVEATPLQKALLRLLFAIFSPQQLSSGRSKSDCATLHLRANGPVLVTDHPHTIWCNFCLIKLAHCVCLCNIEAFLKVFCSDANEWLVLIDSFYIAYILWYIIDALVGSIKRLAQSGCPTEKQKIVLSNRPRHRFYTSWLLIFSPLS
jgi:hypothetical protein